jgi:DNA-directed RNA polymerase II subunit RPB7
MLAGYSNMSVWLLQMDGEEDLALPPKSFGRDIGDKILSELKQKVEGKCSGKYGYIILVTHVKGYDKGVLDEDTGW